MRANTDNPVEFAVEGAVDEAVVLKLFRESGVCPGTPYVCDGIGNLRQRLKGFNAGAQHLPWFVLCDLDKNECAPGLRSEFLGQVQSNGMQFRVAVRAVEAWLIAGRDSFAGFLGVSVQGIPLEPDNLDDPKRSIVDLARGSTKREIREGLVPKSGGRSVGPTYTAEMTEFIQKTWSPRRAREKSPSLERAFKHCRVFSCQGRWL